MSFLNWLLRPYRPGAGALDDAISRHAISQSALQASLSSARYAAVCNTVAKEEETRSIKKLAKDSGFDTAVKAEEKKDETGK